MTDPKELAKAVLLEAYHTDPAAFVAAQYLGLDFSNPHMLQETFGDALRPEKVYLEAPDPRPQRDILDVSVAPNRYVRQVRVMEQPLIRRGDKPPPAMTENRKLFIEWMEKRIPDDDPRIKAMILEGMQG